MSVRTKLAFMFVGLCLIAYGLGGFFMSRWAEGALEDEILAGLGFRCRAYATALGSSLKLLTRRAEDFASDGYIRDRATRLQGDVEPEQAERMREELRRHLTLNKLPLEAAFDNLAVAAASGEVLVAVHDDDVRRLAGTGSRPPDTEDRTWVSGVVGSRGEDGVPGIVVTTPLRSLDGSGVVGRLLVLVNAEDWVAGSVAVAIDDATGEHMDVHLILHDRTGRSLLVSLGVDGATGPLRVASEIVPGGDGRKRFAPLRGTFARSFPIADSGWRVEVTLGADEAMRPVSGLRSRFLGVGVVLAALSALLLLVPMRFVVRPLLLLTQAAQRLSRGEFDTRVEVGADDEIGELGRVFNDMAQAIQERTRRLEIVATELRERQGELRAGRDRLQTVISSMQDGLVVLEADGKVVMSNAAARPLLDLVGRGAVASSHHVCREGENPHARAQDNCFACLLDPEGPPRSCIVDAGRRTFEIHTTLLPTDRQCGHGRVLVSRDITDRVQRDEREIHNERLAVLGEVAAVVAHELNNPLASISMFNQMLAAELPRGSPLRENTDIIARNTDTATQTIRELLDYATGASPEVGPIDVHQTLKDVLRFLRPLSERAGVTVRLDLSATRSEVAGDEVQLRQVFVNLAMNAVQAVAERLAASRVGADAWRPEVTLSTSDDGDRLAVDVCDTGPGIDPEDRERIFRPFFTTKSRGEGTGLGLPTTRRIAELHGGSLTLIDSTPAGTVFRVRLRARAPAGVVS